MRSAIRSFVVLFGLAVNLSACENCGPSAEPSLNLSLQFETPGQLDTLYALNSRGPLPAQPYSTTAPTTSQQLVLPVNLNADSSRYVFRLSGRQDTVTVFYKRDFAYRNRNCGYMVNLTDPGQKQVRTTRGTTRSVYYAQNRDGSFLGGAQTTGIHLTIQL